MLLGRPHIRFDGACICLWALFGLLLDEPWLLLWVDVVLACWFAAESDCC